MFVWCWTYTINFFFCSTYIFSYVTLWPTTSGGFPWLRTCFVIIFTAITSKNHTTHHDSIPEFYLLFKILSFSPSLLPALPFPMCVCHTCGISVHMCVGEHGIRHVYTHHRRLSGILFQHTPLSQSFSKPEESSCLHPFPMVSGNLNSDSHT